MNFEELLVLLFLVFLVFNFFRGLAEKKEEKRRAEEYAEHHAKLALARNAELSKPIPIHMQSAFAEFEKEYRSHSGSFFNMNDFSPLTCFGYRVGKTNGVKEGIRREIIYFTWYANIPAIIPRHYASTWGEPGTHKRYSKIIAHLSMLASQRRNRSSYDIAVSQWDADVEWFKSNYSSLAYQYSLYGFKG
jgi:hypothetical protein